MAKKYIDVRLNKIERIDMAINAINCELRSVRADINKSLKSDAMCCSNGVPLFAAKLALIPKFELVVIGTEKVDELINERKSITDIIEVEYDSALWAYNQAINKASNN